MSTLLLNYVLSTLFCLLWTHKETVQENVMAIEKRVADTGKATWRVRLRKNHEGAVVYTESATFTSETRAKKWERDRLVVIESVNWSSPTAVSAFKGECITLGDVLLKYKNYKERRGLLTRSLKSSIKLFDESSLADIRCNALTSKDVIDFCTERHTSGGKTGDGVSSSTIRRDLDILAAVINSAELICDLKISSDFLTDARKVLSREKISTKARVRQRRPKEEELRALLQAAEAHDNDARTRIKMVDIIRFAIASAMRQGEIVALRVDDVNWKTRSVMVRNRKDPQNKEGNDGVVPLFGEAYEIIKRHCEGRTEGAIFPYTARGIGRLFAKLKHKVGIHTGDIHTDLRFHDLRREGASRLLEMGMTLEEVKTVTGHKDLETLSNIYSAIDPSRLHNRFAQLSSQTYEVPFSVPPVHGRSDQPSPLSV